MEFQVCSVSTSPASPTSVLVQIRSYTAHHKCKQQSPFPGIFFSNAMEIKPVSFPLQTFRPCNFRCVSVSLFYLHEQPKWVYNLPVLLFL